MTHLLLLQAHAHIVSYLKQEMPTIFCKDSKKHNLIYELPVIFTRIQQQHQVPAGDFPDCTKMQVRPLGVQWSREISSSLCKRGASSQSSPSDCRTF